MVAADRRFCLLIRRADDGNVVEMKRTPPKKPRSQRKRDLFAELMAGMKELEDARQGRRTLKTYIVESKPQASSPKPRVVKRKPPASAKASAGKQAG